MDQSYEEAVPSRVFAAAFALALILTPVAVFAGDPEADEVTAFSELDADADGAISEDEAAADAELVAVFADADANGDGSLDRAEFQSALGLLQQG